MYALLPSEHALDYDVLKDCLLRRFDKTEDDFKQKFRACRPESGETFQKFAVRLSGFFNRWIEMSGIALYYENLRDLMIRDQFLHVCNKDVLLFLKERVSKDIGEMSQLADRFKEARRASVVSLTNPILRGSPKNDRKGEDNGFKAKGDNSDKRICYKCGVQGHIGINCPSQGRLGSRNSGNRYGQGQYGKGITRVQQ